MNNNNNKHYGWDNYPTWAMNLWLSEDPLYEEMAKDAASSWELAALTKKMVEENIPLNLSGVYADLLNWAIEQVNWQELATTLWEENKE